MVYVFTTRTGTEIRVEANTIEVARLKLIDFGWDLSKLNADVKVEVNNE